MFRFSAYKDSKKNEIIFEDTKGKLFLNDQDSRVTPNYLKSPTKVA